MLRSLASGVATVSDLVSPLYRTPAEQLTAAWSKATVALQQASATATVTATSGEDATVAVAQSADSDSRWCTPALLRALNQMADALRRDTQHQHTIARRTASHAATGTATAATTTTSATSTPKHQHQQPPHVAAPSNADHSPSSPLPSATVTTKLTPPSTGRPGNATPDGSVGSGSGSGTAHNPSPSPNTPPSPAAPSFSAVLLDSSSACVSSLLHERVLEQLCAFGVSDRPAGVRSVVVRTVDALLSCPHTSTLMSHSTVYSSLARLLAAIVERGDERAKGSRRAVLAFSRTVCSHIAHSTVVAEVRMSAVSPDMSCPPPLSTSPSPSASPFPAPSGCHLLCSVLTSMLNFWSEEGDMCAVALFDLACSPSTAVHAALLAAGYHKALVGGVVELLAQLPPVSVSPAISSLLSDHAAGRALSSRLQAVDALALCAPATIVLPLCADFRERVVEGVLIPLLCDGQWRSKTSGLLPSFQKATAPLLFAAHQASVCLSVCAVLSRDCGWQCARTWLFGPRS